MKLRMKPLRAHYTLTKGLQLRTCSLARTSGSQSWQWERGWEDCWRC